MGFVNNQQVQAGEFSLSFQRLRRADLNAFMRSVSPMPRLHHSVVDGILFKSLAGLVAQDDPVEQHCRPVSLLASGFQQSNSHFCLASTCWGIKNLRLFTLSKT